MIRIEVDPKGQFGRALTELEKRALPRAAENAIKSTGFAMRERWSQIAARVFDRPVQLTVKAPLFKMVRGQLAADVFIRDEAFKGTPPAKYLKAQVFGGERGNKGLERDLQRAGVLSRSGFAVPGRGAQLDAHGNLARSTVTRIKAQLRIFGEQGFTANETADSRGRRQRREERQGVRRSDYFAVAQGARLRSVYGRRGAAPQHLKPGVYQRIKTGFGEGLASILHFVDRVRYRKRFDIEGSARTIFNRQFPGIFRRELESEVSRMANKAFERSFR